MIQERYVDLYGASVSTHSEHWREACEARVLLRMPLEKRRSEIAAIVKKRGRKDATIEYLVRESIQAALVREFEWRKAHAAVPA